MAGQLSLLPAELRIQIYRELFVKTSDSKDYQISKVRLDTPSNHTAQLLRASRTIYSEALPILYGENTILVNAFDLPDLPKMIGRTACESLKSVEASGEFMEERDYEGNDSWLWLDSMAKLERITLALEQKLFPPGLETECARPLDMCKQFITGIVSGSSPLGSAVHRHRRDCHWSVALTVSNDCTSFDPAGSVHFWRASVEYSTSNGSQVLRSLPERVVVENCSKKKAFRYGMVPHYVDDYTEWHEIGAIRICSANPGVEMQLPET